MTGTVLCVLLALVLDLLLAGSAGCSPRGRAGRPVSAADEPDRRRRCAGSTTR